MRKQGAAARDFINQFFAAIPGLDRNQQQIVLPGEMFRRGLRHLGGGREMDESVGEVDRRAFEHTALLRARPFVGRDNFVNKRQIPPPFGPSYSIFFALPPAPRNR